MIDRVKGREGKREKSEKGGDGTKMGKTRGEEGRCRG